MKKISLLFLLIFLISLVSLYFYKRGRNDYELVFSFSQKGKEVKVFSPDGRIKAGLNRIKVEIKPPEEIVSFYFYMPPMPGMNEMRSTAKLRKISEGSYEGEIRISMEGPWQVKVVLANGDTLTHNIFVPTVKGKIQKATSKALAGHLSINPEKIQLLGVITEPIRRRILVRTFSTVGYVDYDRSRIYDITLRSDGWVESTFRRFEGELVKKGTPLMRVLNPEVEIAKSELELARKTGDEELIRKAQEKLKYLMFGKIIRSPVSGVILRKRVYDGGYVRKGETAYRIAELSQVWVIAEVPLRDAPYVKVGQRVLITPEDNPRRRIEGFVDYVFPEVNRASKTLRVRISVRNRNLLLKPNTLVGVLFRIPIGKVLSVPESAVVDTGRRTIVFVEKGKGVFTPVKVKLGRKGEGYYEVIDGLKEGERVVIRGNFLLDAEAQLKGVYESAAGN